jgi:Ca2+-binding RTX toxin-like protein
MRGGAGSDNLSGGTGTNTADYSDDPGGTGIQANLATGQVQNASIDTLSGVQVVIGTSFADALTGDGAANTLIGGAGGDTITGGGGQDSLRGEAGNDTHNSQDGGTVDSNDCGADTDTANADTQDTNLGCETVNNTEPEPPPPPPPGPDTKAPAIDLSGKGKQKDKKQVKVDVSCDEACAVEVAGTIKVPKQNPEGRFKGSRKFDLKGASADLAAGQAQTLKLKLTSKAKKLLKKAIKEKKSTAKVTATGTDAAGNSATSSTFKVKVKK